MSAITAVELDKYSADNLFAVFNLLEELKEVTAEFMTFFLTYRWGEFICCVRVLILGQYLIVFCIYTGKNDRGLCLQ